MNGALPEGLVVMALIDRHRLDKYTCAAVLGF